MPQQPALPKIEITKVGKLFRVDWDYQEAPESEILNRRNSYLNAYIDGVLDALDIGGKQISCAVGRTGTVHGLTENVAKKLANLVKNLIFPMVTAEHKHLAAQDRLPPHLRDGARRQV